MLHKVIPKNLEEEEMKENHKKHIKQDTEKTLLTKKQHENFMRGTKEVANMRDNGSG